MITWAASDGREEGGERVVAAASTIKLFVASAFWLGDGRILHATSRDGLGVNEEVEPESLRARRRKLIRL